MTVADAAVTMSTADRAIDAVVDSVAVALGTAKSMRPPTGAPSPSGSSVASDKCTWPFVLNVSAVSLVCLSMSPRYDAACPVSFNNASGCLYSPESSRC